MKKEYRFEVYTDYTDDGELEYVVKYFDLETVYGVGDTIQEAIEEAQGNLEVFLQFCADNNIEIPEPSSHEDFEYSGKVTLRMPKSLHRLVDERAKEEGVSINLLLNNAISGYIASSNTKDAIVNETFEKFICYQQMLNSKFLEYYTTGKEVKFDNIEYDGHQAKKNAPYYC